MPYSSPSVFSVPGNQLTQQLYPGLPANQHAAAVLGHLQAQQLVAIPQPSPGQLRPAGVQTGTGSGAMTSSGGGAAALQPVMYWYPPAAGGQMSPAGGTYLMPTCATPGLAQVPDMLTLVDGVYEVCMTH